MSKRTFSEPFGFRIDTTTKFGKLARELLKEFILPKDAPIPEGYVALDDHESVAKAFAPIMAVALRYSESPPTTH